MATHMTLEQIVDKAIAAAQNAGTAAFGMQRHSEYHPETRHLVAAARAHEAAAWAEAAKAKAQQEMLEIKKKETENNHDLTNCLDPNVPVY